MFYASVDLSAVGSLQSISPEDISTNGRTVWQGDFILGTNSILGRVNGYNVSTDSTGMTLIVESLLNLKGATGATGETGPAGPQGPKGDTGATGP